MDPHPLGQALRARLGSPPSRGRWPSVSIVVASHDGEDHLRTLLSGLAEHTDYPDFELIVVDNGSGDGSVELLRSAPAPFAISIVANAHNESFSDANNQGTELARGELLLLLNNDIEPFEDGWLRELVACLLDSGAGAVGATLIYPYEEPDGFPHGYRVQHRGLRFRDEEGTIRPALHDWGADPLDAELGRDVESPVVVAACLLLETERYRAVDGLTRGYRYGSEDIDFCLKVRDAGARVVCSGRSVLVHRPGSTRRAVVFEQARDRKERNHRLLLEQWGPRLRREHDIDALERRGLWVQAGREDGAAAKTVAAAAAPGVCVKVGPAATAAQLQAVTHLEAALAQAERRCLVLRGGDIDDLAALDHDVVVHVGDGRATPCPAQLDVLWDFDGDGPPSGREHDRYACVVTASTTATQVDELLVAISDELAQSRFPLRIAAPV